MQARWRRRLTLGGGVVLSGAALAVFIGALRGHWGNVAASLTGANYLYVVPAVGFIAVMYALRIVRWRLFLKPLKDIPYRHVTEATLIGFMSTCVLPLRAGEVIRPYVLSRTTDLDFGHAAGSDFGLGRVFDMMGSFLLVFLALVLLPGPAEQGAPAPQAEQAAAVRVEEPEGRAVDWPARLRAHAPWVGGLALAGLLALLAVAVQPERMLRLLRLLLRPLPREWSDVVLEFSDSVVQSLAFMKSPRGVAAGLVLTLALWFCYPLSTWSLAQGFGLALPFGGAVLVQVLITLAVLLPQAPSFVGVFQVAAMAGVSLYGVTRGPAGAFAFMLWVINVVPITVVGLAVLWWRGLSLRRLAEESRHVADDH